ncbi:MAG: carboxypeptidase-like regulatory domain-containing protein [Polaribacter sp.]|nr:carboxypeptidase-like regulatory domain-containing protein [Polaribacter sp.]
MKKIITLFFLFVSVTFIGQVKGKITDMKNNPLSFVSVYLDNTVTGTTSNDNGDYILDLIRKGKYTIVFQFLGFKTVKKEVEISSFPFYLNVKLEEESVQLSEISISTKDNPANRIIRNVIANKDKNTDKFANYTAKFYSRGLYRIKDAPKKFLGQTLGDFGGGLDSTRSGIIYLSETISDIKFQKKPKNFKENIIASKVSGQDNGISFNRAEDANINFYENSVEFGNNLVSPLSTNAFSYYKFKLEGTFYDKNGRLINKIKILPKRKNDPVFSGALYIVEDDWALYGADVSVTGAQVNIPVVDVLKLKQNYNYSDKNDAWVLISQSIDFRVNALGFKFDGRFSSAFSNYDFTPNFNEKTFTNEVLTFEKEATEKDSSYWITLRPVPLTTEEVKDYEVKDSLKVVRKSKKYLDSVNKKQNKVSFLSPITGYTYKNSFEKWSLSYDGLIKDLGFNTVQGFNTSMGVSYFKNINDKGSWWSAGVNVNYGFSEKIARPTFFFNKKWNNISRPRMSISVGVTTAQFNGRNPISKMDNLVRSLLRRENYLKIFEKEFAKIMYSEEIKNGIYFSSSLEYANRKPLFNTNNYSFARQSKTKPYTSNNPLDPTDYINTVFTEHSIASLKVGATFIFNQKYLSYPHRKFNIGNTKYPSLSLTYRKNFGASNSELNSDVFVANIRQNIDAGNYGKLAYNIGGGLFLKKKNIAFMDNLQANGNQLLFITDNQLSSFGLLEYYKFYTNDRYAEAHLEHNFKGSVLGKIPLINNLNFHLVGGVKSLFMADKKPYSEYSLGLDNIGFGKWRFLRIDYVKSFHAGIKNDGFLLRLNILN